MSSTKQIAYLIYDGDCPVCNNFTKYYAIKQNVDLVLIDARKPHALVDEAVAKGFLLDEGIVVKIGEQHYYSSDAMIVLAGLANKRKVFGFLTYLFFSTKLTAKIIYPICKSIRNLVLKVLGIKKLGK
jgi:predicted DCC family thiol-disulfide oxidoreductase YuxK